MIFVFPKPGIFLEFLHLSSPKVSVIPVSYTHLDVYKRQKLLRVTLEPTGGCLLRPCCACDFWRESMKRAIKNRAHADTRVMT